MDFDVAAFTFMVIAILISFFFGAWYGKHSTLSHTRAVKRQVIDRRTFQRYELEEIVLPGTSKKLRYTAGNPHLHSCLTLLERLRVLRDALDEANENTVRDGRSTKEYDLAREAYYKFLFRMMRSDSAYSIFASLETEFLQPYPTPDTFYAPKDRHVPPER